MTRLLCVGLYVSLFETAHDTWLPAHRFWKNKLKHIAQAKGHRMNRHLKNLPTAVFGLLSGFTILYLYSRYKNGESVMDLALLVGGVAIFLILMYLFYLRGPNAR